MKVVVEPDMLQTVDVDDRDRINLGMDYAGRDCVIAYFKEPFTMPEGNRTIEVSYDDIHRGVVQQDGRIYLPERYMWSGLSGITVAILEVIDDEE